MDGKWGYVKPYGEVSIDPQYKGAFPFSEDGLAVVVTMKNEWLYINKENEPLLVELTDFVTDKKGFNDGLAVVIFKKKKGVINKKGEVVFFPEYDLIYPFSEGFSVAKKGK